MAEQIEKSLLGGKVIGCPIVIEILTDISLPSLGFLKKLRSLMRYRLFVCRSLFIFFYLPILPNSLPAVPL